VGIRCNLAGSLFALALGIIAPGLSSAETDGLDASTPPIIGNINGMKLSIPKTYLVISALRYAGEGQTLTQPRQMMPSFESQIRKFVIRLRLSTLRPTKTLGDLYDLNNTQTKFAPNGKLTSSYYETWTNISISPEHYLEGNGVEKEKNEWLNNESSHGPFVRQDAPVAGLVHEESAQPARGDLSHYEFFYDEETRKTFIFCQSGHSSLHAMTYDDCSQVFIIPELKAMAEATYTKKDLPRWREIEEATQKIVHSFIVQ
jgi:hypothetical protein